MLTPTLPTFKPPAPRRLGLAMLVACGLAGSLAARPAPATMPQPVPAPAAPAGWDAFAPPIDAAAPASTVPAIAEWTRTGRPDDSLILTGADFSTLTGTAAGADTAFLVFGQTGPTDAVEAEAALLQLDGNKAALTLPATLPASATYLVWPRNGTGEGRPVVVNRTEAWWLNPDDKIAPTSLVSVYGRNLSHDGGTEIAWIFLQSPSGSSRWITPTTVNPYRVQFVVPAGLPYGQYTVWLHNGHGGNYGWSEPLSFTVTGPWGWNGATFNVRDYGARGDGSADDADAVRAAATAASSYRDRTGGHPTLYFPAGTYALRFGLGVESEIRYLGDGRELTVLRPHPDFLKAPRAGDPMGGRLGLIYATGGSPHDIEVSGLTLDGSENFAPAGASSYVFNGAWSTAADIRLLDLRIKLGATGSGCATTHQTKRLVVAGCEFIGGELFLYRDHGVEIRDSHFLNANYQLTSINELSTNNFSISNCRFEDLDGRIRAGRGQGRLLAGNSNQGAQRHAYIADNVTIDLGPDPEDNAGEQIICESNLNTYDWGRPARAGAASVTFLEKLTTDYAQVSATAVITAGKGLGQYRQVTGWDGDRTLTVSPAWNVVPDASSVILVEAGTSRWVIYRNTLDGKSHYASAYSAMTAIEPYGGCYEWIGDSNTITNMRTALYVSAVQDFVSPKQRIHPCFFHYYANNRVEDSYHGVWTGCGSNGSTTEDPGVGFVGNVFRRNVFLRLAHLGVGQLTFGTTPDGTPGKPLELTLFEHNLFSNVGKGFTTNLDGTTRASNTVLYRNTFERGTAAVADSFGLDVGAGTTGLVDRENAWSGFARSYQPPETGATASTQQKPAQAVVLISVY